MPDQELYALPDIAEILQTGISTITLWANRYAELIPPTNTTPTKQYDTQALEQFRFIQTCSQAGMTGDAIQSALEETPEEEEVPDSTVEATGDTEDTFLDESPIDSARLDAISLNESEIDELLSGDANTDTDLDIDETDNFSQPNEDVPREIIKENSISPPQDPPSASEPFLSAKETKTQQAPNLNLPSQQDLVSALVSNPAAMSLLSRVVAQQEKLAEAQEKRALAEERKAFALESRAEAERLKAEAMNNIAEAVREAGIKSSVSSMMDHIRQMPMPESDDLDMITGMLSENESFPDLSELPELTEASIVPEAKSAPPVAPPETPAGDDLEQDDIIDLAGPMDKMAERDISETQTDQQLQPPEDIDDLSLLLDEPVLPETKPELISKPETEKQDIDDLSTLLDDADIAELKAKDDIDGDDLKPAGAAQDIDDLSLLIDDAGLKEEAPPITDIDDLSQLIDEKPAPKKPETAASAKTDPKTDGSYKSKILSRIIKMKEKEGLSVEETVERFNSQGIKTLSGKEKWDVKTIQGIYKYIDSVRKKG